MAARRRGRSALARAYQCRDGKWLFISLTDESQWKALLTILPGLPNTNWDLATAAPNEGALRTRWLISLRTDHDDALAALKNSSVPAVRVIHPRELFDDPQVIANGLVTELSHSEWGRVNQTGILTKFSATPGRIDRAAPLLGEHTDEILREYLEIIRLRLAALRAAGIVK